MGTLAANDKTVYKSQQEIFLTFNTIEPKNYHVVLWPGTTLQTAVPGLGPVRNGPCSDCKDKKELML